MRLLSSVNLSFFLAFISVLFIFSVKSQPYLKNIFTLWISGTKENISYQYSVNAENINSSNTISFCTHFLSKLLINFIRLSGVFIEFRGINSDNCIYNSSGLLKLYAFAIITNVTYNYIKLFTCLAQMNRYYRRSHYCFGQSYFSFNLALIMDNKRCIGQCII